MIKGIAGSVASVMLVIFLASDTALSEEYTLESCINIALQNNFGVIAARNSYDAARGEIYTAWGDLLPTATVSASANRNWPGYFDNYLAIFRTDSYSGSLNFSQTYGGLGLTHYANLRRRYNEKGSAFYNLSSARSNLVQQVKQNYYDLLRTKMLVDVASDAVKRGEERLRVTQSRYDLGSASMSDVLKAKVQYGNDKLDLVAQTNAHRIAQANLAYTMGIDVNREIEVEEVFPQREFEVPFDQALSEALLNNPDYRKAGFDLGAASDFRLISYANFLPSLTLGLRHSTNVAEFGSLTDFKGRDASYTAYASLSFNIFNGFNDYAALRAARRNVETAQQGLKDTENKVALEVKQAFLDIEQSEETRKLAEESVAAAQEDLNLIREKYNLGAATILEVLDAEVSLKEAQTNRVQAIFDYNLAVSRLEKVMGR